MIFLPSQSRNSMQKQAIAAGILFSATIGATILFVALFTWYSPQRSPEPAPEKAPLVYAPRQVIGSFGANTEFELQKAEDADWVKPDELVLGVMLNGEARAYLINTLTHPHREIFNDSLGDHSIAATW